MKRFLAGIRGRRRLLVGLVCSVFLHLALFGTALVVRGFAPTFVAKKGDALFVELPKPDEPVSPEERGAQAPPAPKTPALKPPAPKTQARPAPKKVVPQAPKVPEMAKPDRAAEPPQVAKAAPAETEEPKPVPSQPAQAREEAKAAAESPRAPETPAAPGGDAVASLPKEPGAGGTGQGGLKGLRRGRGGIEGDPIPLDTPDPRYSDYFRIVKRQIQEKWSYPREAGDRGLGGQLVIDFVIAKDGHVEAIDLRRSSGVEILDRFAMNAVKLAQPFPPVPDSVSKDRLPIAGLFSYVVNVGFVNHFLR
jgi:TonB family protein